MRIAKRSNTYNRLHLDNYKFDYFKSFYMLLLRKGFKIKAYKIICLFFFKLRFFIRKKRINIRQILSNLRENKIYRKYNENNMENRFHFNKFSDIEKRRKNYFFMQRRLYRKYKKKFNVIKKLLKIKRSYVKLRVHKYHSRKKIYLTRHIRYYLFNLYRKMKFFLEKTKIFLKKKLILGKKNKLLSNKIKRFKNLKKNSLVRKKKTKLLKLKVINVYHFFEKVFELYRPRFSFIFRKKGAITYSLPAYINIDRARMLILRWFIQSAKQRSEKSFVLRLLAEFFDLVNGIGRTIRKVEDHLKLAIKNRPFIKFLRGKRKVHKVRFKKFGIRKSKRRFLTRFHLF